MMDESNQKNTSQASGLLVGSEMPEDNIAIGLLQRGSEALFLEAPMPQGKMQLGATQWVTGSDRAFVARGAMADWNFYRGMFSYDNDSVVFCRMEDRDQSTTVLLTDGSPGIMNVTITHNNDAPSSHQVDIDELLKMKKIPLDSNGKPIDFLGGRKPPDFTSLQLYDAVKDVAEYREFRRGTVPDFAKQMTSTPARGLSKCVAICLLPGCGIFCLFWFKKDDKKEKKKKAQLGAFSGAFNI